MEKQHKTLIQLFIPIALELFFQMFVGMADTLMLSYVGDDAVGAIGTANTYISMFIIMFNIVSTGMVAVMTQYIGAKKEGVAYQARQLGLVFNAILGVGLSVTLYFCSGWILDLIGIADSLSDYANTYFKIVGGSCILNALIPIFSGYLRTFGHTKYPLISTVTANLVNLGLNALFLFVFNWGVAGVAWATVISRIVNLIMVFIFSQVLIHAKKDPSRIKNRTVFAQILKIGIPSACETIIYDLAMTMVISMLNSMDPEGFNVTARSYASQITNFAYCVGAALAQANAILTGWYMGERNYGEIKKSTRKAVIIGVSVAIVLESVFAATGGWIMKLFTDDEEMISIVQKLLAIDIALEIGRVTNLVYGQSLKTSGDALFTTILAACVMFVAMVGGTWLFGIYLDLAVIGAYIGLASDECLRAVGMFLRFKTGKWQTKGFIKSPEQGKTILLKNI